MLLLYGCLLYTSTTKHKENYKLKQVTSKNNIVLVKWKQISESYWICKMYFLKLSDVASTRWRYQDSSAAGLLDYMRQCTETLYWIRLGFVALAGQIQGVILQAVVTLQLCTVIREPVPWSPNSLICTFI